MTIADMITELEGVLDGLRDVPAGVGAHAPIGRVLAGLRQMSPGSAPPGDTEMDDTVMKDAQL